MGDYKHITVNAAEEDDEVVVAGRDDWRDDGGAEAHDAEPGPAFPPSPLPFHEPKPAPAATPSHRPRRAGAGPADGYRETTLDDLEPGPMPLVQKVVIVAAVVCIIGAIVFYFASLR